MAGSRLGRVPWLRADLLRCASTAPPRRPQAFLSWDPGAEATGASGGGAEALLQGERPGKNVSGASWAGFRRDTARRCAAPAGSKR
jgi:hypothetical protein